MRCVLHHPTPGATHGATHGAAHGAAHGAVHHSITASQHRSITPRVSCECAALQVALNTQKDYANFELPEADRALLQHHTQAYGGGLSGPPILARSTAQVAAARAAVQELRLGGAFTVIHVGGLQSAADMQQSRATGAELRQWYSGLMHGLAQPEAETLYSRLTAP